MHNSIREDLFRQASTHAKAECPTCTHFIRSEARTPTTPNMLRHMAAKHGYTLANQFQAVAKSRRPSIWRRILTVFAGR